MKLFIVRHGDKERDEFDSNLTDLGRNQIKNLSHSLKNHYFSKVYSSSNPRSIQTGEIISKENDTPLMIIDSIRELPKEMFFKTKDEWSQEYKDLHDSTENFLIDIIERNENVVLAMHAGINRLIISILLDIPLEKTIVLTQNLGCINILELKEIYGKKRWCVELLNGTYHLNE